VPDRESVVSLTAINRLRPRRLLGNGRANSQKKNDAGYYDFEDDR